jgi:hypothetical protein
MTASKEKFPKQIEEYKEFNIEVWECDLFGAFYCEIYNKDEEFWDMTENHDTQADAIKEAETKIDKAGF